MTDVLLTGLPRSGLTVACALIDSLPDSVCLNAPVDQLKAGLGIHDAPALAKFITGDFAWQRLRLERGLPVEDIRASDGSPLLDHLKDARARRDETGKPLPAPFSRPGLSPAFTLGIKHHGLYTSILPELLAFEHFTVIAVIRHPLDVILSWQGSGTRPIAEGRVPVAQYYWPEAWRISANEKLGTLERMVQIYDAFCERYHALRDKIHILKYEDMIDDPAMIARLLGAHESPAAATLIERRQPVRNRARADEILSQLRKSGVFAKEFYSL